MFIWKIITQTAINQTKLEPDDYLKTSIDFTRLKPVLDPIHWSCSSMFCHCCRSSIFCHWRLSSIFCYCCRFLIFIIDTCLWCYIFIINGTVQRQMSRTDFNEQDRSRTDFNGQVRGLIPMDKFEDKFQRALGKVKNSKFSKGLAKSHQTKNK